MSTSNLFNETLLMKTLILGLGNPILSDDGVGILVARELSKKLARFKNIDVKEASVAGLALLDIIAGYKKLLIIDAIITKKRKPGTIYKFTLDDFKLSVRLNSLHDLNLASVLKLGREYAHELPEEILIYAIEVLDNRTFNDRCTPEVQKEIPCIAQYIFDEILEQFANR